MSSDTSPRFLNGKFVINKKSGFGQRRGRRGRRLNQKFDFIGLTCVVTGPHKLSP